MRLQLMRHGALRTCRLGALVCALLSLWTTLAAAAPRRVALLPMLRGADTDEADARRVHGWLAALIAIRDDAALVPSATLDRGAEESRFAAIAEQIARDPRSPDAVILLDAVARFAGLDRILAARLDGAPDADRTLTLLAFDGKSMRATQVLGIAGALDSVRPQLHDAVGSWLGGSGRAVVAPAGPGVVVDPPAPPPSATAAPRPAEAAGPSGAAPSQALPGGNGEGGRRPMATADAPVIAKGTDVQAPSAPLGVSVDARTNVYADNDGNRIVTPSVSVGADVSEHVNIAAHGALDIMTCASIDVISAATPRGYFQETRQEAGGSATIGSDLARYSASVTGSKENDYSSTSVALGWSDEFAQRNTTVAVGYSFTDSNVGRRHDPNLNLDMNSHTVTTTLTQVLSPSWIAQAALWVGVLDGFQSSVYRFVRFRNGTSGPERMPSLRVREAGVVQLRGALRPDVFVGLSYRLYGDTWGLLAHTAEVTASWLPIPTLTLRVRDRFHTQRGSPYYSSYFDRPKTYMSIDRELGAFWGNLVGGKASLLLTEPTATRRLELDVKFDAMWQTFADFPWLPQRNWVVAELGVSANF